MEVRRRLVSHSDCNEDANNDQPQESSGDRQKNSRQTFKPSSTFERIFCFSAKELHTWNSFVRLLFRPADPASLGVTRFLFGLLMVLDIPDERGLGEADVRWATPMQCYFPLFNFLRPPPLPWMCLIYLVMWIGAFGIMLGYRFRLSCALFAIPYWFILLLEKSRWNNHSYLFGLVAILLSQSSAHHYLSIDAFLNGWKDRPVPAWNYAILRFQFFLLYFYAGVKKLDSDWIGGYSMSRLNNHWVFEPFKIILTPEQVDFWIVHIAGFTLDLTIGFWMFLDFTRPIAFIFCAMFHFMNSRLFMIGMFPYVCLATQPLFCYNDWPRRLGERVFWWRSEPATRSTKPWDQSQNHAEAVLDSGCIPTLQAKKEKKSVYNLSWQHHLTAALLLSHVGAQLFLPYSHFLTKGYNTWTNGLYGYSWDMMVHTWDTILVVVKVVEKENGREHFLDPEIWVHTDRWAKHADMVKQYSHCVERNLHVEMASARAKGGDRAFAMRSENMSIYIDVWCSLNGRFQQRMYDPTVDVLRAPWSPFQNVPWVMPLLYDYSTWRARIKELEKEVHSWSNYTDALFVADFPGLYLENYITSKLTNVSLTVLSGEVVLELNPDIPLTKKSKQIPHKNITLHQGEMAGVPQKVFHRVHTTGSTPACYMYSYTNLKRMREDEASQGGIGAGVVGEHHTPDKSSSEKRDKTIWGAVKTKVKLIKRSIALVSNALLNVLYSVPMVKRVRVA